MNINQLPASGRVRRRRPYVSAVAVAASITAGLAACADRDDAVPAAEEVVRTPDIEVPSGQPALGQRARQQAAASSDRHLELRNDDVAATAAARQRAAGSDRHLEFVNDEVADAAAANQVMGSDRHLELQAKDITARVADGIGST